MYEELEALTRSERERLLATPGFTERLAALWRAQYPMGPLPERWRRSCLVDSAQALLGPGPAP